MQKPLSRRELDEFIAYLEACTDAQVLEVWAKERAAGRRVLEQLAYHEMLHRGRKEKS